MHCRPASAQRHVVSSVWLGFALLLAPLALPASAQMAPSAEGLVVPGDAAFWRTVADLRQAQLCLASRHALELAPEPDDAPPPETWSESAREALLRIPPAQRHWEWHYLHAETFGEPAGSAPLPESPSPLALALLGPGDTSTTVAARGLRPIDHRTLLEENADSRRLWVAEGDGWLARSLPEPMRRRSPVAGGIAIASGRLAMPVDTGAVILQGPDWQVATNLASPLPPQRLGFSPDGRRLVGFAWAGESTVAIFVWDVPTGTLIMDYRRPARGTITGAGLRIGNGDTLHVFHPVARP